MNWTSRIDLDDNWMSKFLEWDPKSRPDGPDGAINKEMARLGEEIGRAGLSAEQSERIMEHARQTSEREAARAQEKVRHAQEKLERKLEASRRKQEARQRSRQTDRRTRGWGFEWPSPMPPASYAQMPPTSRVRRPQCSDDERLMILRMLERRNQPGRGRTAPVALEGRISIDGEAMSAYVLEMIERGEISAVDGLRLLGNFLMSKRLMRRNLPANTSAKNA
jgi:hypothetical protein